METARIAGSGETPRDGARRRTGMAVAPNQAWLALSDADYSLAPGGGSSIVHI